MSARPLVNLLASCALLSACGGGQAGRGEGEGAGALGAEARAAQERLGPILGEVTREKLLDRLEGYALCGLTDPAQRASLRVTLAAVDPEVAGGEGWHIAEVECFFFGFQGLYQYVALHAPTGRAAPVAFEGAAPAPDEASAQELKTPATSSGGRDELCGAPVLEARRGSLVSVCKGNPEGSCGAYGEYTLELEGAPRFRARALRAQPCAAPSLTPPEQWPPAR
jgi:hypothetical protein